MGKRTSILWTISTEVLRDIVARSETIVDILRHFALGASSRKSLFARMEESGIDYSHIALGKDHRKGKQNTSHGTKRRLVDVLVENSSYDRGHLKGRLLRAGLLKNECSLCGQLPEWKGKELVMVLDHINGVNNDHRIENLRLLCPNCNSQQATFAGRKLRRIVNCGMCGKPTKTKKHKYCAICNPVRLNKELRRVERPSLEQLLEETKAIGYLATGRKYGVSDNAIRKWIKFYQKHGE